MDFQIVIDSREQQPYSFACPSVRAKLDAGDYSVSGFEHRVAVERKSLPDFVHTVIHDATRFAAELQKLAGMDAASVVVEANLDDVLRGRHEDVLRSVAPLAILGAALHIALHWGVPVYWCGSRQAACAFTDAYLRMFVRTQAAQGGALDV
jgi:DNA excision repair protein ERCC-4